MNAMMPREFALYNNADTKVLNNVSPNNIFINGYNLVDLVNSVARDEIKKEIKKDVDIVTMEEYGKLVSIISVKDDIIEGLERTDIDKDTIIEENETKMKEQDDYMKDLKCYMEALKNSNIEKDTKMKEQDDYMKDLKCYMATLKDSNIEKDKRIGILERHVENLYDELEPIRSRQLIEAGRKYFWNKSKHEYKSKYPKMVVHKSQYNHSTKKYVNFIEPKEWLDFINFAENKFGSASYWIILKGGFNSDFAGYSSTIHKTDAYTIAKRNLSSKPLPSNYNDLFVTVFKMTMTEALIRVPP
jgi:hypothetical protein